MALAGHEYTAHVHLHTNRLSHTHAQITSILTNCCVPFSTNRPIHITEWYRLFRLVEELSHHLFALLYSPGEICERAGRGEGKMMQSNGGVKH